jgi:deoxycytidine triphosphate deaminase
MILTGDEIKHRIALGELIIEGYTEDNVNPNSYDLTLSNELVMYTEPVLDLRQANPTQKFIIPEAGFILRPGEIYLASTRERTELKSLVGKLYAKSSIARLGLNPLSGGGYGDTGFAGQWTLALTATRPTKIYPGMKIVQIEFSEVIGDLVHYSGKYQDSNGAQASKSFIKE